MKDPIKNDYLENLANSVADSINSENAHLYKHLMEHSEFYRTNLNRSETLEFRDRVHYLADNPAEIKLFK